jgi:hypothetical protein
MTNKLSLILLCLSCCIFSARAQSSYSIKGTVTDTTTKIKLEGATIAVVTAKDSILQKFVYTSKGVFNISGLKPGKLLLMVTYPDHADYTADFELDATHPEKDFGDIPITLRSMLLNDVIIKAKAAAIKIKGDTTEFNASSYATAKNAKVEDLLKQLPGMRINQSGVILFQGEQVQKVLVDGEEFFGDDPALVTKNLRADMVSKIQVYDDKSETAKQTGVDDGQKIKTINVKLREDKKRGIFGKADAEAGTDKRYSEQLMANKFTPKEKMSVYGNLGNTGSVGLNGGDNGKYGGGFSSYAFNGVGIPAARDAGVHYDGKWNKDKQTLNTSYKLGALDVDKQGNSQSQINLPGTFNRTNNTDNSHTYGFNQSLDAQFTTKLDSTTNLYVSMNAAEASGNSISHSNTITTRENDTLLNTNNNNTTSDYESKNARTFINLAKRFKKPGRSITLYTSGNTARSNSTNYQRSDLKYYNPDGSIDLINSKLIDQYKPNINDSHSGSIGVNYTEPIFTKGMTLSVGYSLSDNKSNNNQLSFNKSASGVYDVPDLLHSNNYSTDNSSNDYGLMLYYSNPKFWAFMRGNVSNATLTQTDHIADSILTRKFVNLSILSRANYQLSKAASIRFEYNGYTQQPSITQIQPLRQNNDPLNIQLGNPLLRPAYNNAINVGYRLYQNTYDRGINFRVLYSNEINAIVSNRTTVAGVNTYQYSNLTNKQPYYWNVNLEVYGHPKNTDLLVDPSFNVTGNTSYSYVNNSLSETHNISYNPGINAHIGKATFWYSLLLSGTFTQNHNNLQPIPNNSKGYEIRFEQYTKLPLGFFVGSEGQYDYTAPNQVFPTAFSRFLVKAYFGKNFLKEENLKVAITGNDLLNQNSGYSRNGTSDNFTESRNNVIRRFFMFSVTWDFSKFGKAADQPQQK